MKLNWPGKKALQNGNIRAVAEACIATIILPAPGFEIKETSFGSSGFREGEGEGGGGNFCVRSPKVRGQRKLQALVYDILPSTTAVFSYTIGSRKLSANEQFFLLVLKQ